jgi:hypothetical protein
MPVDVASGTFSFADGAALSDRAGQPLGVPDITAIQAEWQNGSSGAAPSHAGSGSRRLNVATVPYRPSVMAGYTPPGVPGRLSRLSDPITPEQAAATLRGLTERFTELASEAGRRVFRHDHGSRGVMVIEFDPVIGAVRRSEARREGVLQSVTERTYDRRGTNVYLASITTTVYGSDGNPRGTFVTRFAPRDAGRTQ